MKALTSRINNHSILVLIKIAASAVFLGRAWQFIIWDAPFRAFFWDESLMKGLVNSLGLSWSYYLENIASDTIIGKTYLTERAKR